MDDLDVLSLGQFLAMLPPKRSTRSSNLRLSAANRRKKIQDSIWASGDSLTKEQLSNFTSTTQVSVSSVDEGLQIQISKDEKIPKKPRRKLTLEQQNLLEKEAIREKYPSLERRRELADSLGL